MRRRFMPGAQGGNMATMSGTAESGEFIARTEPFRRELLAHCYRMLGSIDEAEDVVQETYVRAWRGYDRFEGRSTVRAWLYRIATNASLTALEYVGRRALPSGLGAPSDDPEAGTWPPDPQIAWLQPVPDALVAPESDDPAVIVASRQQLRLALVASLQYLPPRQRAVLLLREVMAFPAAEVAEILDMSVVAVKSMLQRARVRLEQVTPEAVDEPSEPEAQALLERYITAFEASDPGALRRVIRDDIALEMTPSRTWFKGLITCMPVFVRHALRTPGEWRLIPIRVNGQLGTASYERDPSGVHRPFAIVALTISAGGIAGITLFCEPALFPRFGMPARLEPGDPPPGPRLASSRTVLPAPDELQA
jgi:RNA polymerase sigma-70 factor (ECF subfamily)